MNFDFENTRRELMRRGREAGWKTAEGHTYSNLNEQLENMRTYVRPDWALHECQTLPYQIQQQMKRLPPRAV